MDNPGPFQLTFQGGAFSIASAGTFIGDWIEGFEGMLACSLQGAFAYGSGGTTVKAYIQSSIDQGQTPADIACFAFATTSATKAFNLSGLTPETAILTPTQLGLADNTAQDGLIGDRLRAVVVVTGTYQGSTILNLTGVAR